ncbi:SGNH/GDSL hydrolase family protein [Gordoniibacillus kamchatkensis]|uniref:SGNH/GDSL hydrolase family protein n=1 Tax=Gordoniibacillus kamchatkensis TaxID=1590651 RepID=UPI000695B88D|nr:GDSL-type esterase/lipase family protein [Paenibacillus sp. VKM B-2647]
MENQPTGKTEMRVVCAGCSITRGQVSIDYVEMLRRRFAGRPVTFANSGVNYDVAFNLQERLNEVIAQNPDIVTILIGTNDANSTLSPKNSRLLRFLKKLPVIPSPDWYKENLNIIVKELKERTNAHVALLSLPVIGEDVDSEANRRTGEYSAIINDVAKSHGVTYLPLNERMKAYLQLQNKTSSFPYRPGLYQSSTASMQHFMLRRDLDTISSRRGLQLTIDNIHLNSRGAGMVADLIESLIIKQTGNGVTPLKYTNGDDT